MNRDKLDELIRDARAAKEPFARKIHAQWAGIEAVKIGAVGPCPFGADEADLVAGYETGVAIRSRADREDRPVFDCTPFHLKSFGPKAAPNTYAARSAPKEED